MWRIVKSKSSESAGMEAEYAFGNKVIALNKATKMCDTPMTDIVRPVADGLLND